MMRRLLAALFVVVGIGAVSSVPAQADPTPASQTVQPSQTVRPADDWHWSPR